MTADPFAMSQEIIELQSRVAELSAALETVTEQRDSNRDISDSIYIELESTKAKLAIANSVVDRLRLHIQQGVELPEFLVIEAEEHLIQQHRLGLVAGGLEHEVGAVFSQQLRGLVNQVALLRKGSQIDGGVTHNDLQMNTQKIYRS